MSAEKRTVSVRTRAAKPAVETEEVQKSVDLVVEPGTLPDFGALSPNVAAPKGEAKVVFETEHGLKVEHY